MRFLSINHIAQTLNSRLTQPCERTVTGYAVDTRLLQPGQIFFALRGARVDSHTLLPQVAAAGAIAAVVESNYSGPDYGMTLLHVPDVLQALQTLAHSLLQTPQRPRIVAITGSVGKTTTKEFLRTLVAPCFRMAASPGNQNSQIGLPLTLLNHTDGSEELLILEMGMTLPGQISQLVQIAPPDIAVLTMVALVHAGNFANLEAIAQAKGEIFTSPHTHLGILPAEVCDFERLCELGTCRKRSYTTQERDADYRLVTDAQGIRVVTGNTLERLPALSIPGRHNLHNLLAAVTAARELGVDWEVIRTQMTTLCLPDKRLQTVVKAGITFINDSYNAPPIGVQAALTSLPSPKSPSGRRVAVLGTMPELGLFSEQCHRQVGEHALKHVDLMFCWGAECHPIHDIWQTAGRPVHWFLDKQELVQALKKTLRDGDVVLIKGENRKQMWQLLDEEWE